jgi:hypothetical protein
MLIQEVEQKLLFLSPDSINAQKILWQPARDSGDFLADVTEVSWMSGVKVV